MYTDDRIDGHDALRAVYRQPSDTVKAKVIDHIDPGAADFIAQSPFVVLSTAALGRADASPRGGPPGFVQVLDDHHLAWGDLTGNNRLDSLGNLMDHPSIGMLFMVPGVEETLRVRGSAALVRTARVLDACALDGRRPKTAVVVTVQECYIQCGAALRRAALWNTETWPSEETKPSGAAILKSHLDIDVPVEAIEADLAFYYDNHIWAPGGRTDD
jgi:PPOX class probable FMN-dependent enzyme